MALLLKLHLPKRFRFLEQIINLYITKRYRAIPYYKPNILLNIKIKFSNKIRICT